MKSLKSRNKARLHRKKRINKRVRGNEQRPRLCVFRSQKDIYIQLIDDGLNKVIYGIDSRKIKSDKFDVKKAFSLGELAAKEILEKKINQVAFDRGGYKFHGKVKSLSEGLHHGGLKF